MEPDTNIDDVVDGKGCLMAAVAALIIGGVAAVGAGWVLLAAHPTVVSSAADPGGDRVVEHVEVTCFDHDYSDHYLRVVDHARKGFFTAEPGACHAVHLGQIGPGGPVTWTDHGEKVLEIESTASSNAPHCDWDPCD